MKISIPAMPKVHWLAAASKVVTLIWQLLFRILQSIQGGKICDSVYLIAPGIRKEDLDEVTSRAKFYIPTSQSTKLIELPRLDARRALSSAPVLFFGPRSRFSEWLIRVRPGTFDVDFRTNPFDGWAWTGLAENLNTDPINYSAAYARLTERIVRLKQLHRTKCYVFGTGPSLSLAKNREWSDGYRIVCNTIVRDPILWHHIRPDFIVAGDAIYHFGHTRFASAFRRDLRARLEESDALFVFPAQFYPIVVRELADLKDRLAPVPSGWSADISRDLTRSFWLPRLGNVLGLLLLPLACTLSKHICLWGFDGRAPKDKLFWSNSSGHTYAEYLDELTEAHPRFFEHYVPQSDPNRYTRDYQGERLEAALRHAEKKGWTFQMLHPSWTPILQKRYQGEASPLNA